MIEIIAVLLFCCLLFGVDPVREAGIDASYAFAHFLEGFR